MNRLLKIIATIIVLIVLIIIIGIVVIILFIDPNHFKPFIIKQVKQETGRTIRIPGKLSWSFFPSISITTGELSLSNPNGFGNGAFLHVDSAKAEVRLYPLIKGDVVPKTIDLQGLTLNLIRNRKGKANWQFSHDGDNNAATAPSSKPSKQQKFHINLPNIDIGNATIEYNDQQTGQHIQISKLNLQAEQAHLGKPFPLAFNSTFSINNPKVSGDVDLNATVTVSNSQQQLSLQNLSLNANIQTPSTQGKTVPIRFNGNLQLNTNTQSLNLKPMSGQIANLAYQGYLSIKQTSNHGMHYQGALNVDHFNAQTLLSALGQKPIDLANANALQAISFNATLSGSNHSIRVDLLKANIDKAELAGNIDLTDIKNKIGKFNLNLDHLNLDQYQLKKTASTQISASNTVKKPVTIQYPTLLKQLQMAGMVHAKDLTVSNLHFNHLESQLVMNRGDININPLTAELYHGDLHGSFNMNLRPSEPTYAFSADLEKLQLQPLLQDLFNTPNASGTLNMHTRLNTLGSTDLALKQHLDGQAQIHVKDAVIKNIDLDHYYKMGVAFLNGNKKQLGQGNNETNIGSLSALFNIDDGVAHNDDLRIDNREFMIKGSGMINLVDNTLQYHLIIDDRKHTQIPLKISGSLSNPSVGLDHSALAKALRHKAEKHIRNELQKKLHEHLGNLF